jgi:imidazolonepropionase-like amidohydrolase
VISARFRRIAGLLGSCCAAWAAAAQETQPTTRPATQPADTQPAQTQPTTRDSDSQPARGGRGGRGGRRGERGGAASSSASSSTSNSSSTSSTSTGTSSSQAAAKKDHFLAVTGGRVHTVTGPVLAGATILCKNGKIISIGKEAVLPQECEIVDAAGRDVYPGLVACNSVGVFAPSNLADNTDVFGLSMDFAVAAGITSALAGNEVGKLTYGGVEDMLLSRNTFYNLAYTARNPLEKRKLRADLDRVRGYLRDLEKHEIEKLTDKDAKAPDKEFLKGRYEELRKLLAGETIAVTFANTADELLDLVDLVENYGIKLVVRGAYEGWIVAEHLGRAGIDVIMTPRTSVNPDPAANRLSGSTIENAALLHKAGVRVAVVPLGAGIQLTLLAGRDLLNLNLEAAFAVRGGLSNDDALKTITIDAARVMGVDDRVGSLEVGKDADIIVADGDLLHYMTMVQYTVVNGRLVYDKSKQTLFSHIRPAGKIENATFDDVWPRKLEWREDPPKPASAPSSAPASSQASTAPAGGATSEPASKPTSEDE